MPNGSRPIREVLSPEEIRDLFMRSFAVHEKHRQRERDIEQQRHHEALQLRARRRRPMTNTISGLGDQIQAALAATRHAQDKALAERRRERELAAARDEMRAARLSNNKIGG
jgi:hypothetical protein